MGLSETVQPPCHQHNATGNKESETNETRLVAWSGTEWHTLTNLRNGCNADPIQTHFNTIRTFDKIKLHFERGFNLSVFSKTV